MKLNILFLTGLWLLILFCSGCKEDDDGNAGTENDSDTMEDEIEIFSWWTDGGEAGALQALIDAYQLAYPGTEVVNVSAESGDGQAARAALDARMANNDPPDTFQLGPRDFQNWVEFKGNANDNRLEPLNSLFATEGWEAAYPQGVLDVLTYGGSYYAVPVNMHRQNTLLYNMELVPVPPTTMAEFLTLAAELRARGIIPLAVSAKGGWTLEIIFFSVMAGSQGPAFHDAFFTGALDMTDPANLAKLQASVTDYSTLMSYANLDAAAVGWDMAADKLIAGTAAMYIHGDWAKGYYESKSWLPGQDFGVMAVPGSQGEFIYNVDTFALCSGAKNRENALDFLRVIGGATAQQSFNKLKGSTPVHRDVDITGWDVAAESTFNDFHSATILHNVEINQFSIPDAAAESGTTGLTDKLLELFNGTLDEAGLITWMTTNYVAATQ